MQQSLHAKSLVVSQRNPWSCAWRHPLQNPSRRPRAQDEMIFLCLACLVVCDAPRHFYATSRGHNFASCFPIARDRCSNSSVELRPLGDIFHCPPGEERLHLSLTTAAAVRIYFSFPPTTRLVSPKILVRGSLEPSLTT